MKQKIDIFKNVLFLCSTGKKESLEWHFIVGWAVPLRRVNRHIVACLWSWIYRGSPYVMASGCSHIMLGVRHWVHMVFWDSFFWCCTYTNPPTLVSRSNCERWMCHATLHSNRDVLNIFVCWRILSIDDAVVCLNAHCNFNQGIKINVVSGP